MRGPANRSPRQSRSIRNGESYESGLRLSTRLLSVACIVSASLASGSVDHRSSRIWSVRDSQRHMERKLLEDRVKLAKYRETHPEVDTNADLPKRLASIPEEKLDIGIAALELAHEFFPDLDIAAYSRRIDEMAAEVRKLTQGSTSAEYRIRVLNTYFYKWGRMQYNWSDPTAEKIENRYLKGIMDSGVGNCFTMPLLYHAVAQRLGYPIKFVLTPRHSFLRYDDPKLKQQNIETASYGTYLSDDYYKQWLPMKPEALKNGIYMRTLSNREFLADLIAVSAGDWGRKSNQPDLNITDRMRYVWKATQYLLIAEKLDPRNESVLQDLAKNYEFMHYLETLDAPGVIPNPTGDRQIAQIEALQNFQRRQWAQDLVTAVEYYEKALALGLDTKYYTKKYKQDYLADIPRLKRNHEIYLKRMAQDEEKVQDFVRKLSLSRRDL